MDDENNKNTQNGDSNSDFIPFENDQNFVNSMSKPISSKIKFDDDGNVEELDEIVDEKEEKKQ